MDIIDFLKKAEGGEQYVSFVEELRKGRNEAEKKLRGFEDIGKAIGDRPVADLVSTFDWVKSKYPKGVDEIIQLEAKAKGTTETLEAQRAEYEKYKAESDSKLQGIQKELENTRKRAEVMPVLQDIFGDTLRAELVSDRILGSISYGEDGKLYRKNGDKSTAFTDSIAGIKEEFNSLIPKADGSQLPPNNNGKNGGGSNNEGTVLFV